MMVTKLAGLDGQVDVIQDETLALGIAKGDIAQLDLAPDAPG